MTNVDIKELVSLTIAAARADADVLTIARFCVAWAGYTAGDSQLGRTSFVAEANALGFKPRREKEQLACTSTEYVAAALDRAIEKCENPGKRSGFSRSRGEAR